jgi:hypothetical protein
MDKVKKYRQVTLSLLSEIANDFHQSNQWEILEIFDENRGQYALFADGWINDKRDYGCLMHIEVKNDGKVWLRRDGTDLDVGNLLLAEGIEKPDLVLAFRSPSRRAMTAFAVS